MHGCLPTGSFDYTGDVKNMKKGSCKDCRHYRPDDYCYLMDDIVQEADNCGMFDKGDVE